MLDDLLVVVFDPSRGTLVNPPISSIIYNGMLAGFIEGYYPRHGVTS